MKILLIVLAVLLIAAVGFWYVLRPWYARWGATDAEVRMQLPGDEIAGSANMISTRAVSVRAPAATIYPWLAQIGQARGGMYSYEWLENLVGCNIHNVYHVVPELQQLQVGQIINMGPEGFPFYRVHSFEPGRVFVLQPGDPATKEPGHASWTFFLQEQGDGTTRLIARQRQEVAPGAGNFVMWRVMIDPISFFMEQKMLRTVRDLAEKQS